jgi:hypothetical protein
MASTMLEGMSAEPANLAAQGSADRDLRHGPIMRTW